MAKWDAAYLINLAESMGGMTGPLGVSVLHAEVAYTKASALLDIVGSSFAPHTLRPLGGDFLPLDHL